MEHSVIATVVDPQADSAVPENLVTTFRALLEEADFSGFLNLLGAGRFSFRLKRSIKPVFRALCTEIWRLAIHRAFPDRCEETYALYLNQIWTEIKDPDAHMALLKDIARFLPSEGTEDFTPAAHEICVRAGLEINQAELVGMALFLRRLYEYFFNHLL